LDLFQQHNEWFYPHDDPLEYGQLCWGNASLVGKKTARFLSNIQIEMIVLPRQARDKHRGKLKKDDRFLRLRDRACEGRAPQGPGCYNRLGFAK
jgi:hypothetical protein